MITPQLSICINTRNRACLLAETLDSMISQISTDVEIVVVDGASTDDTPKLMREYVERYSFIRYVRSDQGLGIDDGYDLSVKEALGKYCWLMTDDDLLDYGALDEVLSLTRQQYDLIILNLECYTRDLKIDLQQRLFNYYSDRTYTRDQFGLFLAEFGKGLSYIGCVVIRREYWFEHERAPYYGTYFIHVGVLCNSTYIKNVYFLNKPIILYRSANSSWTARSFEIWYFKWPNLIWSFSNLPEHVRMNIVSKSPWDRALTLLKSRAMGEYDVFIFWRFLSKKGPVQQRLRNILIAILPKSMLSLGLITFCLLFRRSGLYTLYTMMVSSPWPRFSRQFIRAFGIVFP